MPSTSSEIYLTNNSGIDAHLCLEPWGDVVPFPNKSRYRIVAEAAIEGVLEVEYQGPNIIVWAWSTCVLLVFSGDDLISEQDIPFPAFPSGMEPSKFLRTIFGDKIDD